MTTPTLVDAPATGVLHDLKEVVHDIRHSRGLIYQLTLRDIRVRYKQALMGFAWAILSPLLRVVVTRREAHWAWPRAVPAPRCTTTRRRKRA